MNDYTFTGLKNGISNLFNPSNVLIRQLINVKIKLIDESSRLVIVRAYNNFNGVLRESYTKSPRQRQQLHEYILSLNVLLPPLLHHLNIHCVQRCLMAYLMAGQRVKIPSCTTSKPINS